MPNIEWILLYFSLGAFVGFMGGLLGVGGGGILVPLLTSTFIYQGLALENVVHLALGTSLASMIISSLSSIRAHALKGTVVWSIAGRIAPGILIGAFVITRIVIQINSTYIAIFFSLFMALIAAQMFMNWQPKTSQTPNTFSSLFIVGTLIGAVSALAVVGGGFLTVMYLSFKNIDMKKAVGTSAAIGLPIAVAGTIGYMINGWSRTDDPNTFGFVYVPAFLMISISSAIAAPYGVRSSNNLSETHLKKIFAVLSIILSLKMLFQLLNSSEI